MAPSVSASQRRLFGMVLAKKRGQLKNSSPKVEQIAKGISEEDASDFAKKKRRNVAKSLMTAKSGY